MSREFDTPMHDVALCAAFLAEGLHDAGYDEVIAAWDKGWIELIQDLTSYAEHIERRAKDEWMDRECGFPGVFHYEVTSVFGEWFGKHVIEHGTTPDEEIALTIIEALIYKFFNRKE